LIVFDMRGGVKQVYPHVAKVTYDSVKPWDSSSLLVSEVRSVALRSLVVNQSRRSLRGRRARRHHSRDTKRDRGAASR
jgi:hypothetical protein